MALRERRLLLSCQLELMINQSDLSRRISSEGKGFRLDRRVFEAQKRVTNLPSSPVQSTTLVIVEYY